MFSNTLRLPIFRADHKIRCISIGWISLSLAIIVGSTSTTFAKQLGTDLPPLTLLLLSESIVLLFTILSFGFVPLLKELIKIRREKMLPILIICTTNGVVAPLLAFSGLRTAAATNAELYLRSSSFFLFIYASLFLHEKIRRTEVMALLCMFFGLSIVALRGFSGPITLAIGDTMLIGSAMTYALGSMIFKKYLPKIHTEIILFCRGILAISFFIIMAPILHISIVQEITGFPVVLIGALIGYSFLSRFLYLFSYYESLERMSAHTIAMLLPLMSIGSLLFAHIYLGEPLYWYHAAGCIFILLGSIIIQFSSSHFEGKNLLRHLRHGNRQHI